MGTQGITRIDLQPGDILMNYGDDVENLYLLIKGKITAYTTYGTYTFGAGTVLGITGSNFGLSTYTYVADADSVVQAFPCREAQDVLKICETYTNDFPRFVQNNHRFLGELIRNYLTLLISCRKQNPEFALDERINRWELDKYNAIANMDQELVLTYHKAHAALATAELVESSRFASVLNDACLTMADVLGMDKSYVPPAPEPEPEEELIALEDADVITDGGYNDADILNVLKDSLEQILKYADWEEENKEEFREHIHVLRGMKDRTAPDEESRALRRKVQKQFYDLYYRVFIKAARQKDIPTSVSLFLNFGYVDEGLVGAKNAAALYKLNEEVDSLCNGDHLFTIYTWLKKILGGERQPCKNGFDQSYDEYIQIEFREGRMKGNMQQVLMNTEEKLRFEIDNVFKTAHYMTFGRLSNFLPVLTSDIIGKSLDSMLVSVASMTEVINKIREIDYSLFYRSRVYSNTELKIGKEFVYSEVLPDIILMPTVGVNGVMWQEIDGRNRMSSARMLFPIFLNGDLTKVCLNTFGKFRWEMCKRIQGAYWNNISEPSLTSEYCDYLQFYKKNHDLSEEVKQKIHSTLTSCRNNFADYFAKDYENWILYESHGAGKLNKVSRKIIGKYCPFNLSLRNELRQNPMFADTIGYAERQNMNKRHHLDNIIQSLSAKGLPVPREIEETRNFFAR